MQMYDMGFTLHAVAAAWLVFELTGSAAWVGVIAAAPTLLFPFLSLPAGTIADRVHRGWLQVMAVGLLAASLIATTALAWGGELTPSLLLMLTLLLGVGDAFYGPAWQARIADLVPEEQGYDAVALNATGLATALAVGPALGGVVLATAGPTWTFTLSATAMATTFVVAAIVRHDGTRRVDDPPLVRAMSIGLRHVWFRPGYRWAMFMAGSFVFAAATLRAVLPNLTSDTLGGGETTYGLLLTAFGTGAFVGALTRGSMERALGGKMIPVAVAAFGIAGVCASATLRAPIVGASLVVAGMAWTWSLATLNAVVVALAPDWVRARVVSIYLMLFAAALSAGSIINGAIAERITPSSTLFAFSAALVVLGVAAMWVPGPHTDATRSPQPAGLAPPRPPANTGEGEVVVATTWRVADEDLSYFLTELGRLRVIRMTTGASGWSVYQDADLPNRIVEVMVFRDWGDYDRLVRRLDLEAVESIRNVWSRSQNGSPTELRLLRVDQHIGPSTAGNGHRTSSTQDGARRADHAQH
jgi:MFS family permease